MITTTTEIKYVEHSFEVLNAIGIQVELKDILVKELETGLPSDINNGL